MSGDTFGTAILVATFGTAAVAKGRSFSRFVEYLGAPCGRFSRYVAAAVIGGEVGLAVGLVLLPGATGPLLATGLFLLVASGFLAFRLVVSDDASCACWGVNRLSTTLSFDRSYSPARVLGNVLVPAWFGFRNGVFLFIVWLLLGRGAGRWIGSETGEALFALLLPPFLIAGGLVSSVVSKRRDLLLDEHPHKASLAPRMAPIVAPSWYMGAGELTIADPALLGRRPLFRPRTRVGDAGGDP